MVQHEIFKAEGWESVSCLGMPWISRRIRCASLLLAVLGVMTHADSTFASVIYRYTGRAYETASHGYTTDQFVSIELELSERLPTNWVDPDGYEWASRVRGWRVSDGISLADSVTNNAHFYNDFVYETDGAGLPTMWALGFLFANDESTLLSSFAFSSRGAIVSGDWIFAGPRDPVASTNIAGTWRVVPEPVSALLVGLGLGCLAVRR